MEGVIVNTSTSKISERIFPNYKNLYMYRESALQSLPSWKAIGIDGTVQKHGKSHKRISKSSNQPLPANLENYTVANRLKEVNLYANNIERKQCFVKSLISHASKLMLGIIQTD